MCIPECIVCLQTVKWGQCKCYSGINYYILSRKCQIRSRLFVLLPFQARHLISKGPFLLQDVSIVMSLCHCLSEALLNLKRGQVSEVSSSQEIKTSNYKLNIFQELQHKLDVRNVSWIYPHSRSDTRIKAVEMSTSLDCKLTIDTCKYFS